MAGWSAGYQAALVRRQLTPGLISSLPKTAGFPPFISFSTSYRELDSALRRPMRRIDKRREEYFAVAQAALLEPKHRKSIGNPGEIGAFQSVHDGTGHAANLQDAREDQAPSPAPTMLRCGLGTATSPRR
jgi:hypothetical protein